MCFIPSMSARFFLMPVRGGCARPAALATRLPYAEGCSASYTLVWVCPPPAASKCFKESLPTSLTLTLFNNVHHCLQQYKEAKSRFLTCLNASNFRLALLTKGNCLLVGHEWVCAKSSGVTRSRSSFSEEGFAAPFIRELSSK